MAHKLNVGCGRNILPGWLNLDVAQLPGVDIAFNLERCKDEKIPLENDSVEEFLLSHLLEHVNNALPLMEELYRIAQPNALAKIRVPHGSHDDAWEDPTHVRPYFPGSFGYFSQPFYWRADYGYRGDWRLEKLYLMVSKQRFEGKTPQAIYDEVHHGRNMVLEMVADMRAVTPIRQPLRELQTPHQLEFVLS